MTREELISSPEYWITGIQLDLLNCAREYMDKKNINQTKLAKELGVSKGYISQVLNGDYNHRISKLVELSLAFGYVPQISFVSIENYIQDTILKWSADKKLQNEKCTHGFSYSNPNLSLLKYGDTIIDKGAA